MEQRINLNKAAPELYKTMGQLEQQSMERAVAAGWSKGFCHLLKLRASQINGCAFCARMHTRDALAEGESSDRISVIPGPPAIFHGMLQHPDLARFDRSSLRLGITGGSVVPATRVPPATALA